MGGWEEEGTEGSGGGRTKAISFGFRAVSGEMKERRTNEEEENGGGEKD